MVPIWDATQCISMMQFGGIWIFEGSVPSGRASSFSTAGSSVCSSRKCLPRRGSFGSGPSSSIAARRGAPGGMIGLGVPNKCCVLPPCLVSSLPGRRCLYTTIVISCGLFVVTAISRVILVFHVITGLTITSIIVSLGYVLRTILGRCSTTSM